MYHDAHEPLLCVRPEEAFDTLVLHASLPVLVSFERSYSLFHMTLHLPGR